MGERDEFDRIVEGLELDLTFDDEPDRAEPAAETRDPDPQPSARRSADEDEEFYRRVEHRTPRPRSRESTLAWIGLAGSPLALVAWTLAGRIAPRPVVAALALVFIGSAIYLISRLPEHGPGRDDDPDDGAVL